MANGAASSTSMPYQARVWICAAVLFIYAGIVVAAFMWGSSELQVALAGASIPMAQQSVGYFFNSSASSDKKDDALATAQAALAASSPVSNLISPASLSGTLQMTPDAAFTSGTHG